jgi:hypothetical protein
MRRIAVARCPRKGRAVRIITVTEREKAAFIAGILIAKWALADKDLDSAVTVMAAALQFSMDDLRTVREIAEESLRLLQLRGPSDKDPQN